MVCGSFDTLIVAQLILKGPLKCIGTLITDLAGFSALKLHSSISQLHIVVPEYGPIIFLSQIHSTYATHLNLLGLNTLIIFWHVDSDEMGRACSTNGGEEECI
jgi:hypothetical protein